MAYAGKVRKVLVIVENLPVPFDRRVWQESLALKNEGYEVSIICPNTEEYGQRYQVLDGIHIYRHALPLEADGGLGYLIEYASAFFWEFSLSLKIFLTRGFDAIHACNPPDTIFLIGMFYKVMRKKFIFDHHDILPELYLAKFNRKGFVHNILRTLEYLTFRTADVSIATNESFKKIAIERGKMSPDRVFVVRSGPDLQRMRRVSPVSSLKKGRSFLVGYLGVMGKQEGIDCLLRVVKYIVVNKKRTDIHFALVGSGTEFARMKAYAFELGVNDYVTFTGRIPDREMLKMLNTADICVNPDVPNEMNDKSTMNKIMEYMALAKPIVQFDLTEGRYTAQKASLYARPGNETEFAEKILELLDDPEKRQKMGDYGLHRVKHELEWSFEKPNLIKAYDKLFSIKNGQGPLHH